MNRAFIQGERLYLRALNEKDLEGNYANWFNDPEVSKYNSHGVFPSHTKAMQRYVEELGSSRDKLVLAIIHQESQTHIGNVSLQQIDWIARTAEFAIIMGEPAFWGKGFATEASKLIIRHGFQALNLNRIHCGTSADNTAMRKLALTLKMTEEGTRRQAMYKNGIFKDMIEYGVLRSDFQSA